MEPSATGSSKGARTDGNEAQVPSCLVDGCIADLSKCRRYYRRHKVCEVHCKVPIVTIEGQEQRFCQQCSRFHSLVEFEEGKRSCRRRLAERNRRRMPQSDTLSINSGRSVLKHQGGKQFPFLEGTSFTPPRNSFYLFLINTNSSSPSCNSESTQKVFPDRLTQAINFNRALSLPSSPPQTNTGESGPMWNISFPPDFSPYGQQEKREPFIISEYQNTSRSAVIEILEGLRCHGEPFKISECVDEQILDPAMHSSLEYLEFDSCIFNSSILQVYFPLGLKELKITNCVNPEYILTLLMDQKYVFLESLYIDGCSTLLSLPIDRLPSTIRHLKIVNCKHLKSLGELVDTGNHDSAGLTQLGDANLRTVKSTSCLELKHLVICDCPELEFFPESLRACLDRLAFGFRLLEAVLDSVWITVRRASGLPEALPEEAKNNSFLKMASASLLLQPEAKSKSNPKQALHTFNCLELLLVSNCSSLISFQEGGLPSNSLIALLIYECESLKFLPTNLHEIASLHFLNISDCPSLMSIPKGGLPPNLISLSIIDCENLIHLSHRNLHKLKSLKSYTIAGGRLTLNQK